MINKTIIISTNNIKKIDNIDLNILISSTIFLNSSEEFLFK